MMQVITGKKQKLTLETQSFLGEGGEGKIYRVTTPKSMVHLCVKIYARDDKAQEMRTKIEYMIAHPPVNAPSYVRFCWPEDIVFENGKFVGFLMPLAFENSQNLYRLIPANFKKRKVLPQSFKTIYDRANSQGIVMRMKLVVHLSAAFHLLTRTGKYCVVDLKPDNILVTDDLKVSIVDCDSFQIVDGRKFYPGSMCTPEYAPPEFYTSKDPKKSVTWDYFSFAILIYQLMYGVHPFAGTFQHPYEDVTDLAGKIQHGLFVHGAKLNYVEPFKPGHPHLLFKNLPLELQQIWINTFGTGLHLPSSRSSFEEFGGVFAKYVGGNIAQGQHSRKPKRIKHSMALRSKDKLQNLFTSLWDKLVDFSLKGIHKSIPFVRTRALAIMSYVQCHITKPSFHIKGGSKKGKMKLGNLMHFILNLYINSAIVVALFTVFFSVIQVNGIESFFTVLSKVGMLALFWPIFMSIPIVVVGVIIGVIVSLKYGAVYRKLWT